MEKITLNTPERTSLIDITDKVQKVVDSKKVKDGFAVLFVPHTTAAITINENADEDVASDIEKSLDKIVPSKGDYSHSEGNSDAHIKSTLVKNSEFIIIENGKLQLGRWQGIFFSEFDGPREMREVWVKIFSK